MSTHEVALSDPDRIANSNFKFEFRDGDSTSTHYFFRSSSDEQPVADVIADLTRFDLTGCYWTPLWKSGRCSYEVDFQSSDPGLGGKLTGSIEMQAFGIYSARSFRESFREAVREVAFDAIEQ